MSIKHRLLALFPGLDILSWALADQLIVSGSAFLTTVLVARLLEVADFGRFVLSMTAVLLVQIVQNALITAPMLNLAGKQPDAERASYSGAVMLHQILFSIATTGLVWLALLGTDAIRPDWHLGTVATATALLVFVGQAADFVRRYFFAHGHPHAAFAVDFLRNGAQIGALWFMLREGDGTLNGVLVAMAAAALAACLLSLLFIERVAFSGHSFRDVGWRHWRFSRWLLGSFTLEWLQENYLVLAIGAAVGLAEVGAYRAAQQLVNVTNVPLLAFSHILPRQAGAAYVRGGVPALEAMVRSVSLRFLAPFAVLVGLIGLNGEALLSLVYGTRFSGAGYIVSAFAVILLVQIVREVITVMNRVMENTAPEFYAQLAGCAVVLIFGVALIRAYGAAGALVATGLYGVLVLGIVSASYWRHRQGR